MFFYIYHHTKSGNYCCKWRSYVNFSNIWFYRACVCGIGYHAKSETYAIFLNFAILIIFGLVSLAWYDKLSCQWPTPTHQLLMISVKHYEIFFNNFILKTCSKKIANFFGNFFWKYFSEGQSEIPWKISGLYLKKCSSYGSVH